MNILVFLFWLDLFQCVLMSSTNNQPTEALLVDVELVSVEAPLESQSTEEQPLHQNRNNLNSNTVKSYQSTAPTAKARTVSSASDESALLPDVGYSPSLSKTHVKKSRLFTFQACM